MSPEITSGKIITIDCKHVYPELVSAYLVIEDQKAAFIETNTQFAVPVLISTLKEQGLKPEDVEYIIITHVHLDHAGGTSSLVEECPNAVVLAHKRAARHIIDPAKLIKAATSIYGEEQMKSVFGRIEPVDSERVRVVEDGEIIEFGSRQFKFVYTLGHAKHHMCIYDSASNGIFTGDSFGLSYPMLQKGNKPFIYPSTTPPDFDPAEARKAIEKIVNTGAEIAFLTHFGPFNQVKEGAEMMVEAINEMEAILNKAVKLKLEGAELLSFCQERIRGFFNNGIKIRNIQLSSESHEFFQHEIALNAQGVAFAAQKMHNK